MIKRISSILLLSCLAIGVQANDYALALNSYTQDSNVYAIEIKYDTTITEAMKKNSVSWHEMCKTVIGHIIPITRLHSIAYNGTNNSDYTIHYMITGTGELIGEWIENVVQPGETDVISSFIPANETITIGYDADDLRIRETMTFDKVKDLEDCQ
jgi:hypothetical protein